jgi:bifunctional DNA-binding transcriptional regulator/antitoxin component of YhaV-PrlF toxin-antitoxin module
VTTVVKLDGSNRIVLPLELRRAAGVPRGPRLKASATPWRIVLEMEPDTRGKVTKRGKLKLWTGQVPSTPPADAVEVARHYQR